MGCQCVLVAALSEEGDSAAPVPPGPTGCWTRGTARGLTGLHGQPGLGQYLWTVLPGCHGSADCLEQEITWQSMENEWDNNKFILFLSLFFCLSFISMFQMESINPVSFWYSDIPVFQLGFLFFFFLFIVIMLFYSFKRKAQNLDSKGKTAIMSTNILFLLYISSIHMLLPENKYLNIYIYIYI